MSHLNFQAKNYNLFALLTIFESFKSLNFRAKTIQNCKINLPNETFFWHFLKTVRFCNEKSDFPTVKKLPKNVTFEFFT